MRIALLWIVLCTGLSAMGQVSVELDQEVKEINHVQREGISIKIPVDIEEVGKKWEKHLRSYGKVRRLSGNQFWLEEATVPDVSNSPVSLLSSLAIEEGNTSLFCAYSTQKEGNKNLLPQLQQHLYDFSISLCREQLQAQISEAEKTVEMEVRELERLVNEGESLQRKLERNELERKKLEEDLLENLKEQKQLKELQELNSQDQENALAEIERLRQIAAGKQQELKAVQ